MKHATRIRTAAFVLAVTGALGAALDAFADANEDPTGFRVTSEYVIAVLRRPGV